MRQLLFSFLSFIAFCTLSAQDMRGIILDSISQQPVEYANIIILAMPDSTFVTGTTSDSEGHFSLQHAGDDCLLLVRCLGYCAKTLSLHDDLRRIELSPESYGLNEVVVRASIFSHKPDGVTALIVNTPLSRLGTATDILPHLPFVTSKHDELKVFGKGTPVVYVNNRKISDLSELDHINSDEVQSIKVITTPGAEYDATTNAVIRITTSRPTDEGWSGSLTHRSTQDRQHSLYEQGNFNYRHGDFDLFGSMVFQEPRSKYRQNNVTRYRNWEITESRKDLTHSRKINPSLGFNQIIASRHSLGMKYDFLFMPSITPVGEDQLTALHGGQTTHHLRMSDARSTRTNNHQLNAYYLWQITDGHTLQADIDYANFRSHNYQSNGAMLSDAKEEVLSHSHQLSVNEMTAAKVTYQIPVLKGLLKAGAEYASTVSDQQFSIWQFQSSNDVSDSHSKADQNLMAGFLEYTFNSETWTAVGGLRYESANFRYDIYRHRDPDASRTYGRLFPSAVIMHHNEHQQITLSYHALTQRPSYWMLRNNMAYNSPYQYEGGNPQLRSAFIQDLSLSYSRGDLTFNASYQLLDDIFGNVPEISGMADSVMLFCPRNFPLIRNLMLAGSYDTEIGKWNPCLEVTFHKQWIEHEGTHYSTPGWEFSLQNQFHLPADILMGLDLNFCTGSHTGYGKTEQDFLASLYLTRSFFGERMRLNLKFDNIFNTSRDRWSMTYQGIYMSKDANYGERCIQFTINYNFRKANNKYRGQNASYEINRL